MSSRRLRRSGLALLCVAAALLAHVAVWLAMASSLDRPLGERVSSVQVRQIVVRATEARADVATDPTPPARAAAPRPRPRARGHAAPTAPAMPPPAAAASESAEVHETSEPAAPVATVSLPTYPTRIPHSILLTYALQRGTASGEASLRWQVDGDRYALQWLATISQGRPIDRHSQGGFDVAGLAPQRLADRRNGRDVRAANFQRERGLISFSGPRWEWPLHGGTQDRLSWLVQLVAIASAAPDALHEGVVLSMWVVGTRGARSAWHFEVRGREPVVTPGGEGSAWLLVREPEHPYDLRIELWLDPAHGYWPLRLRQTQVPGGEPLEWVLRGEPQVVHGN